MLYFRPCFVVLPSAEDSHISKNVDGRCCISDRVLSYYRVLRNPIYVRMLILHAVFQTVFCRITECWGTLYMSECWFYMLYFRSCFVILPSAEEPYICQNADAACCISDRVLSYYRVLRNPIYMYVIIMTIHAVFQTVFCHITECWGTLYMS